MSCLVASWPGAAPANFTVSCHSGLLAPAQATQYRSSWEASQIQCKIHQNRDVLFAALATSNHHHRMRSFKAIAEEAGINVDYRTLRRAFHTEGYYRRVATQKPYIDGNHIQNRLDFVGMGIEWPQEVWDWIVWSDEAHFRSNAGECV